MSYRLLTFFDWALIATSLFNTVALLWLGLTVLLNAERRSWGTWVAGGGLLFGAAFFVGHTAMVGRVIGTFSEEMELWWRLGWLVLLAAPYLWYLVMAWYSGALRRALWRRWLILLSGVGMLALLGLLLVDPLPDYGELVRRGNGPPFSATPLPDVALIYPLYSVTCCVLALLVLRVPHAHTDRFMGAEARRRARPWLLAATWTLLAVGIAVAGAATWVLLQIRQGELPGLSVTLLTTIIVFDLGISLLIALAIVLIGEAVVAYEVFTGKVLPRGELRSQWRRALILAAGYGLAVGWSLSGVGIPELPIYQLLIATVLMTVFYALLGWRSFEERQRALASLRPFVAGQRRFEGLVQATPPGAAALSDEAAAFRALCGDLLGARSAHLIPLGPLASLAGPPLSLPAASQAPVTSATQIAANLPHPLPLCLPVPPASNSDAIWAVPLAGDTGLIGMLLLGAKRDGGLYTEEEIALARSASERLVDSQAAAEMSRRLVALQRQRLLEDQLLDRRARRLLHDEVLPRIHAVMLTLAAPGSEGPGPEAIGQLAAVHKQISELLHDLPSAIGPTLERHGPLGALRRAVEDELAGCFEQVGWELAPEAEARARQLEPLRAEALYYATREAARNAARHARGGDPSRRLSLQIGASCRESGGTPMLEVWLQDDGVGLHADAEQRSLPQSGAGLALHSTILAILGGALSLQSTAEGTSVTVSVPA